ncbi:MAG TPA: hypothetical protein VIL20_15930 [Sandaracinaceae bacterium]
MRRTLLASLIATLIVAVLADDADAQRRRRRRRPPAETEQTQPEEPAAADAPDAAEPPDAAAPPVTPPPGSAPAQGGEPPPADALPPEPSSTPIEPFDPGPAPPDISPIRADYVALMDDLVQARMRVHALGNELFRTRIRIELQDRTGGLVSLARLVVHLDGAPVFQSDGPVEHAQSGREIFTGAVAPGPHVLTLEVEQRARDGEEYRYSLRESFRFQAVRERLSEVTIVLEDASDMARSFPAAGEGRYEVRTRMRVATRALPTE